jgi:hypothetical protein
VDAGAATYAEITCISAAGYLFGHLAGGIAIVNHQALSSFIWSVADLLRGDYKRHDDLAIVGLFVCADIVDLLLLGNNAHPRCRYPEPI